MSNLQANEQRAEDMDGTTEPSTSAESSLNTGNAEPSANAYAAASGSARAQISSPAAPAANETSSAAQVHTFGNIICSLYSKVHSEHGRRNFDELDQELLTHIGKFWKPIEVELALYYWQGVFDRHPGNATQRVYAIEAIRYQLRKYNWSPSKCDAFAHMSNEEECPVCLMGLINKALIRKLACQHSFHESCIAKWLKKSNTCPLCRQAPGEENPAESNDDDDDEHSAAAELIPFY